jgi:dethiobiotin synthetase
MKTRSLLTVVAGTGTEVGKTWFATRLLDLAHAEGIAVSARKPAQSFAASDTSATDAELLARATGEHAHSVCPAHRWYSVAMAPPMAADSLGRARICLDDLIAETQWPPDARLRLVETAGGLLSPIAHDADNLQLIHRLAPHRVILVADAGLGTLNAVRLCARALSGVNLTVFLNRYDAGNELHRANRAWLTETYALLATVEVADCLRAIRAD